MTAVSERQRKEIDRIFADIEAVRIEGEKEHAERRQTHPAPLPHISAADAYADTLEAQAMIDRVVETYLAATAENPGRTWSE